MVESGKRRKGRINIALVEDLVDRQSDSFSRATFSEAVETALTENEFVEEAKFC